MTELTDADGRVNLLKPAQYVRFNNIEMVGAHLVVPWKVFDLNAFDQRYPDLMALPDGPDHMTSCLPPDLMSLMDEMAVKEDQSMMQLQLKIMTDYIENRRPFSLREPLVEITQHPDVYCLGVLIPRRNLVDQLDVVARQREQPRHQAMFEIMADAVNFPLSKIPVGI